MTGPQVEKTDGNPYQRHVCIADIQTLVAPCVAFSGEKSWEIGFVLCFRAHIYGVAQRAKKSRRPFRAKDSNSRSQSQTFVEQNRCNGLVRTVKCTLSICFFFTSLRNKIIISLYIQLLLVSLQTNSRISCLVMKTYSMTFFSTGPHRSGVSPPCCGSE